MRWYEGIWWIVLFACFLLYIAKHPENFTGYYGNKRGNLIPFNISIFYGNGSSAIPSQTGVLLRCCQLLSSLLLLLVTKIRGSLTEETRLVVRIVTSAVKWHFVTSEHVCSLACAVGAFEVG
jgi:hypothetical protein